MHLHLLDYTKENYGELETALKKPLEVHRQSLQNYLELMEWTPSLGSEITLLIICHMFNISILVVHTDFIWVSENIAPFSADVVIVQNCNGHFLATKHIDSKLVDISEVPRYTVNKCRSPYVKTSTPKERGNDKEDMGELIDPGLSPILEQAKDSMKDDTGFSLSETNSSTRMLLEKVKQFEERTIEDKEESISAQVQDKKVTENVQKLDIRDIRNGTSSDISGNIPEGNKDILMMPNSTQPIDIMTEDDHECTSHKNSVDGMEIDEKLAATTEVNNDSTMTEGALDISKTVTPTEDDFISMNDTYLSTSKKPKMQRRKRTMIPIRQLMALLMIRSQKFLMEMSALQKMRNRRPNQCQKFLT